MENAENAKQSFQEIISQHCPLTFEARKLLFDASDGSSQKIMAAEYNFLMGKKSDLEKNILLTEQKLTEQKLLIYYEEIDNLKNDLALVLALADINYKINSIELISHDKNRSSLLHSGKLVGPFKNYFTISNISNRAMELAFGSTLNAIILLLITPLIKLVKKTYTYLCLVYSFRRKKMKN